MTYVCSKQTDWKFGGPFIRMQVELNLNHHPHTKETDWVLCSNVLNQQRGVVFLGLELKNIFIGKEQPVWDACLTTNRTMTIPAKFFIAGYEEAVICFFQSQRGNVLQVRFKNQHDTKLWKLPPATEFQPTIPPKLYEEAFHMIRMVSTHNVKELWLASEHWNPGKLLLI